MQILSGKRLKTGGNPCVFTDFQSLLDELNKLQHPARPDVDWPLAEKLCLNLFRQNGVELQTAAWYTLARTRLAGLAGLNEGLAIIEALVTWQWATFWPQPAHARAEIFTGLSLRLQVLLRAMVISPLELKLLYETKHYFSRIGEILHKMELARLSPWQSLQNWIHSTMLRLENTDEYAINQPQLTATHGVVLETAGLGQPGFNQNTTLRYDPWAYKVYQESEPKVVIARTSAKRLEWKGFIAGLAAMAMVAFVAPVAKDHYFNDESETQIRATLSGLPKALTGEALARLRYGPNNIPPGSELIELTSAQLKTLMQLKPDWSLVYGTQLVNQTEALWSDNPQKQTLKEHWHRFLTSQALPSEKLEGWYKAKLELERLTERLNNMDRQKGRYITGSELKTMVFAINQAMNESVPLEEQLRQLSTLDEANTTMHNPIDLHFQQLLARYTLIKSK
jgi:type VI secretion system protein VasL